MLLETTGRSQYLMWDYHLGLVLLERISHRKDLIRLSSIILSLVEGCLNVPAALELEGLGLDPKCNVRRIQSLVTAFLRVFRIQEKANLFWLRTLEGRNTDYLLFSTKNTNWKRPFSNPVPSPKPPLWKGEQSQGNCNRGQNKATTARDLR